MWTKNDMPDQTGKTAIVTGANTGVGYETALALYRLASAHAAALDGADDSVAPREQGSLQVRRRSTLRGHASHTASYASPHGSIPALRTKKEGASLARMQPAPQQGSSSPMKWIAIGCGGVFLALTCCGGAGAAFYVYSAKQASARMEEARAAEMHMEEEQRRMEA